MNDKMQEELNKLTETRAAMRTDLIKHTDLCPQTQRAIRVELHSIDAEILSLRKEIEDMYFQELVHEAWKEQPGDV